MARAKKSSKEKPAEILELEKVYSIKIVEENDHERLYGRSEFTYSLRVNGSINELTLREANINDLTPLIGFAKIESLNLTLNSIKDISPIAFCKGLTTLYLGGNLISDITSICKLSNLRTLALWGNRIESISPLIKLPKLEQLYCQSTGIKDLSNIHYLKNLDTLYLDGNVISDITAIASIENLKEISFVDNQISEIGILENMKNPVFIDLRNNRIKNIPQNVAKNFNWLQNALLKDAFDFERIKNVKEYKIFLAGNPLEFPPPSVIQLGPDATKEYYESSEEYGHAALSEGRIIFVGDGSSGKTSLIERILSNTFEKGREQTNGIKVEHLHLLHPSDQRDLAFHVWDFGGQEIQHAVHKFFFTEGCLYVLVLDNRKEEEPEYWLQQIESLGGKAPVIVVFNKQDENAAETADRKYLKEKYPNIVGFFNTSCQTGFGLDDFKWELEKEAIKLRTVEEQFPKNWFKIKKAIEKCTAAQHYLNYDSYLEICKQNNVDREETQKLLLKYFTTIGDVTWFGDTYLNFLHVLNPAWITQGVYKIITAKKTAVLYGQIEITDFKELLQPLNSNDYKYDEKHYGYILSMMKKFDLCDTPDDQKILIPSAFGKMPKVEYSEYKGENISTYILQFKDYMPLALLHRFVAKNIPEAYDNNFWYTGIVIKDSKSETLAMVQADKEAKRIYIRIKGESKLGVWEHIRRELFSIASSYANINYSELVALDENTDSTVNYEDLVSYVQAKKFIYFHPKLKRDFNVGYLMGLFESKDETIEKIKKGVLKLNDREDSKRPKIPPITIQILNNNSPQVNTQFNTQINIDIDIQVVNELSSEMKGDASYLLETLGDSNKLLSEALQQIIKFADDSKAARNSGEVKEKGWGRKLKNVLQTLGSAGEQVKNISEGGAALTGILKGIIELAKQFNFNDIVEIVKPLLGAQ